MTASKVSVEHLTADMAPALADLHASAFSRPEAWSASAFEASLAQPATLGFGAQHEGTLAALILIQQVDQEIEILTLATRPEARRHGHAQRLLLHIETELRPVRCYLDVAEDNPGAIAFYDKMGFTVDGRRPRYYHRLEGPRIDAILMSKRLARQTPI